MAVKLTQESILAARQQMIDNCHACVDEVKRGDVRVNDPESYFKWKNESAASIAAGGADHTFTLLQRAHFIQTGVCVPLLP